MSETTNKYSPELRERAVRMVLDGAGQHESRWAAMSSEIGCAPQPLKEWVKKVEIDTGQRGGIMTERKRCPGPTLWLLSGGARSCTTHSGECVSQCALQIRF